MAELLTPQFLISVFEIILINILLSGDNAVVIALACRNLPDKLRRRGILWGVLGAIVLRIILTVVLIAFSVGLLPSSFMAQTPAGLITRQKLRAVPKSFGQITDCGPAALDPTFGGTGKVTTSRPGRRVR